MGANKGFTLLELMVVIAIIGFLMTIGIANYMEVRKKARDAKRIGDIKALREALEIYRQSSNPPAYPTGIPNPCTEWKLITPTPITIMNQVPGDPAGDPCKNPSTNKYWYTDLNGGKGYKLAACMESKTSGENIDNCPNTFTKPPGVDCPKCYVITEQ